MLCIILGWPPHFNVALFYLISIQNRLSYLIFTQLEVVNFICLSDTLTFAKLYMYILVLSQTLSIVQFSIVCKRIFVNSLYFSAFPVQACLRFFFWRVTSAQLFINLNKIKCNYFHSLSSTLNFNRPLLFFKRWKLCVTDP